MTYLFLRKSWIHSALCFCVCPYERPHAHELNGQHVEAEHVMVAVYHAWRRRDVDVDEWTIKSLLGAHGEWRVIQHVLGVGEAKTFGSKQF